MGAQWKQKWREASALKRGQLFGKLAKEIIVAARTGGPDPDLNARLFAAIESARKQSVPRDTIARAVKKGAGLTGEQVAYELVAYEGFAPHKVPVIVECLTDNRNRTAPEIRRLFKAGALGQPGSMHFFFEHRGVVEATHTDKSRDPESDAIEAGAQDVEALEADEVPEGALGSRFLTDLKDLAAVSSWITKAGWKISASEMRYIGKTPVKLDEAAHKEVAAFLNEIDDHDDVHHVYAAMA